jgi:FtsP/CotA-like multicopper oxidase with cupredoxin domain
MTPIPPKHRTRTLLTLLTAGLLAGGLAVGMAAQAGASSPTETTASASSTATPVSVPAAATTAGAHAGMDMGGSASSGSTATAPAAGGPPAARTEPYGTTPLPYTLEDGVKVFHLTAAPTTVKTDDTHVQQVWAYNGQVPGPVIRARVGDRVRIVVTNHLPEPTTIHWHGINLPNSQDGVPGISQKPIAPGASFTYEFTLRRPGLAMYHPHYDTLGQQTRGLYGALVVDPATGPDPGVQEVFQVLSEMNGQYLINGKSYPATDGYTVHLGKPVLVRTINVGEMDHPMHLHGFLFKVVGVDGGQVPTAAQYERYTQDVAPGEAYDFEFTPNELGTWLFHCHILAHVTGPNGTDAGMITAFKVVR